MILDLPKNIEGCDRLECQIEIVSEAYEPKVIYETKETVAEFTCP